MVESLRRKSCDLGEWDLYNGIWSWAWAGGIWSGVFGLFSDMLNSLLQIGSMVYNVVLYNL